MRPRLLFALVLAGLAGGVMAEDVFVGSRGFQAGLHQDRTTTSPIVKLVPAGSALQVLKREGNLTLVRDSAGVQGWIDNSYLASEPPAEMASDQDLRKRIESLEQQLASAREETAQAEARLNGSGKASEDYKLAQQLRRQNQDLEKQLNAEKLRSGELQVELTELRKRIGINSDNESLYNEIAGLQAENRKLRVKAGELGPGDGDTADGDAGRVPGLKGILAYAAILLLVGFGAGIYALDWMNRRRHGGFRV